MSDIVTIATRLSDVFFAEGWKWKTFRGIPQEGPFIPNTYQVADYLSRLLNGAVDDPGSHPRGRVFLRSKGDGRVEVYMRMGTLDK